MYYKMRGDRGPYDILLNIKRFEGDRPVYIISILKMFEEYDD